MTKEEFLSGLRTTLSGTVSAEIINDNMNYYEEYINTEMRKERTEQEVIDSLGDPRLIAKTIAETAPEADRRGPEVVDETGNTDNTADESGTGGRMYVLPVWATVLIIAAVILFAILAIAVIGSILYPVLIPLLIVGLVIYAMRHH